MSFLGKSYTEFFEPKRGLNDFKLGFQVLSKIAVRSFSDFFCVKLQQCKGLNLT